MRYTLSQAMRDEFAKNEPAVKAALCVLANQRFLGTTKPEGIGKYEGGIVVNGREIAIKRDAVMDDWIGREERPTEEERVTAEAIETLARIVSQHGIDYIKKTYGQCHSGDPLRALTLRI
jgi:hypothetical protein